jgi:hypothetical protein
LCCRQNTYICTGCKRFLRSGKIILLDAIFCHC